MRSSWLGLGASLWLCGVVGCSVDRGGRAADAGQRDATVLDGRPPDVGGDVPSLHAPDAPPIGIDVVDLDVPGDSGCSGPPECLGDDLSSCLDGVRTTTPCPLGCAAAACRRVLPSNVGDTVDVTTGT